MPPGFWKYKENVACECRYHCRVHLQWTLRWYLQSHGPNWSITDAQLSVCLGYRRNTEQACLVAERAVWVLESRQSVAMYDNFFLPQTSWPLASLGTSKEITCLLYIAKQYGIDFEPLQMMQTEIGGRLILTIVVWIFFSTWAQLRTNFAIFSHLTHNGEIGTAVPSLTITGDKKTSYGTQPPHKKRHRETQHTATKQPVKNSEARRNSQCSPHAKGAHTLESMAHTKETNSTVLITSAKSHSTNLRPAAPIPRDTSVTPLKCSVQSPKCWLSPVVTSSESQCNVTLQYGSVQMHGDKKICLSQSANASSRAIVLPE